MTDPTRAVFLSYASQDTEAARRICDALRAAGIEVWFDQSELRGGDAWDRQIRQQIHDCALFIPIISANTEARLEGYFRLEWRLAVERTHLMADRKAFLVPVVVDNTKDYDAEVPASFRAVQWTRLPDGSTPPAFIERVSRLLSPGQPPASARARTAASPASINYPESRQPAATPAAPRRMQHALLLIAAVAVIGVGYFALDRFVPSKRPATGTQPSASTAPSAAATQSAIPEKSVAVLPFADLSEKKDQEYFSDGLTEELIDLLTQVQDLRVPARTSSFFFKGKQATIAEIARALSVAHVLEGSVRKSGNTLRVTAQLIRADNGYHVWSKTYDADTKDIFKVQDQVAAAVVEVLKAKLAPARSIAGYPTANPEAHNQYLLALHFAMVGRLDDLQRATEAFGKAISLDPHYAAAYAGLAYVGSAVADQTGDATGLKRAEAMAEKAVELAPQEAAGYAVRGYLRFHFKWDWAGAQADLSKALAINPADADAYANYADLLASVGRMPESLSAAKRSVELDPLSEAWGLLGQDLMWSGDYPAAGEALHRRLEISPDSIYALNTFGMVQLLQGKAADALMTFRSNSLRGFRLTGVAMAEHSLRHVHASQQALDEAVAQDAKDLAYQIAETYAWRGERDKAFEWLERAYQQRDGGLCYVKFDPLLASLRGDRRYKALLRKMNLPE